MNRPKLPVFCMEIGPPKYFYCYEMQEQVETHLEEFADILHEFMYWDGGGRRWLPSMPPAAIGLDDSLDLMSMAKEWLNEREVPFREAELRTPADLQRFINNKDL